MGGMMMPGSASGAPGGMPLGVPRPGVPPGTPSVSQLTVATPMPAKPMEPTGENKVRVETTSDSTVLSVCREITEMGERLHLPSLIMDRADTIFRKVKVTKQLKGQRHDAIAAACLFIACREETLPRTFQEICSMCKKSSRKTVHKLVELIDKSMSTNIEPIRSSELVLRYCADLALAASTQENATYIVNKAYELDLVSGRRMESVAAAGICMACEPSDDKRPAKDIADVTNVAESTIKLVCRVLHPHAHRLFP